MSDDSHLARKLRRINRELEGVAWRARMAGRSQPRSSEQGSPDLEKAVEKALAKLLSKAQGV